MYAFSVDTVGWATERAFGLSCERAQDKDILRLRISGAINQSMFLMLMGNRLTQVYSVHYTKNDDCFDIC